MATREKKLEESPFVDPRIWREKRKKLKTLKKERSLRMEKSAYCIEFFDGLVPHSYCAQLYYMFYLFRRFFLVLIACRYNRQPQVQLLMIASVCLVNQIYLLQGGKIFKDKSIWKVEVFNDLVVMLAILHANVIIVLTPSPELAAKISTSFVQWDNCGISLASIVVLNLFLNQTRVMIGFYKTGKKKCSRWFIRA